MDKLFSIMQITVDPAIGDIYKVRLGYREDDQDDQLSWLLEKVRACGQVYMILFLC